MTTLNNGNKEIKINFDTGIKEQEVVTRNTIYTVTLPEITCTNKDDAIKIEMKVNEFVNALVKDIIKK